jgi:hypothetical protein
MQHENAGQTLLMMASECNGQSSDGCCRPVIVMCHARSGSTLLAYVLNANPQLYCPAETNLGQALGGMARWAAEVARNAEDPPGTELLGYPQVALIRRFVEALYSARLQAERASRWCDKSLGTHIASELIERVFPDAQFVCLYRNFPDFAASALEASPFGLRAYGFESYTQETPGNAIFSLARYWVDHVRAIMGFQDAHPKTAFALTYEAFVQDFAGAVEGLGAFLDAPWDDESVRAERIFRQRYSTGFQDHKITATSRVRTESVNRQWTLPVQMIPPPTVEAINELHMKLGYPAIDAPQTSQVAQHHELDKLRLAELDQVVAAITERLVGIKDVLAPARPVVIRFDLIDADLSFAVTPRDGEVRWLAPPVWDVRVSTTIAVLRDATKGTANVASLMTSGHLKAELTEADSPDFNVVSTMHHFWRAISDPGYVSPPIASPAQTYVVA